MASSVRAISFRQARPSLSCGLVRVSFATVGLLIASCGSADSLHPNSATPIGGTSTPQVGYPPGSASPSAGPLVLASPGTLTLTAEDSGRPVAVPVGSVDLAEHTQGYAWQIPESTNPAAVRRTSGAKSADGSVVATYTVRAQGTAALAATNDCQTPGCGGSSEVWRVVVTVAS
jgi:hypothetical protein